ncbi:hypothetical protein SAMN02745196_01434 [Clostridium collagenovorans DSM 3089]|uniref:Uncharacterized protein n=1 Tax=Clostridium collagenovorans DSM 3089 TaxID=1121306 RepID=A0A1M5VXT4_9CLOT|nr:hypothetical protein [Clostridium collagenovorans]SHH80119.1 hypothetical protein SAMN02745196_01434 [Clostridium collagenovorans DSM 3089]
MKRLNGLIVITGAILISVLIFKIEGNYYIAEDEVIDFINNSEITSKSIDSQINSKDIKEVINIDNKKLVFFKQKDEIWLCEFTKGMNNKYKYNRITGTSSLFLESFIRTYKNDYFIICGYNYGNEIEYRKVTIENKEYKINLPKNRDPFIVAQPIDRSKGYAVIPSLELYDINNNNITSDIKNKYKYYYANL